MEFYVSVGRDLVKLRVKESVVPYNYHSMIKYALEECLNTSCNVTAFLEVSIVTLEVYIIEP